MNHNSKPINQYSFQDAEGHRLRIVAATAGCDYVELSIKGIGDLEWRSLNIASSQARSVATALLNASRIDLIHRRDELAKQVARKSDWSRPDVVRFADLQSDAQAAIDMIIQLQDEASK